MSIFVCFTVTNIHCAQGFLNSPYPISFPFAGTVPDKDSLFGRCKPCALAANQFSRTLKSLLVRVSKKKNISPAALATPTRTLPLRMTPLRKDTVRDVEMLLLKSEEAVWPGPEEVECIARVGASLTRIAQYVALENRYGDINPVMIHNSASMACYFCPGIQESEEQVLGGSSVALGKHSGTLRHVSCVPFKVVAFRHTNSALCNNCQSLQKTLDRSSAADRSHVAEPGSKTALNCLNTPEKKLRADNTAKKVHRLNDKVVRLEAVVSRLRLALSQFTEASEEAPPGAAHIFKAAAAV